jgi:hypothetical protein
LHKLKTKESPFLAPPRYRDSALRKMPFFWRGGIFFNAALWRLYGDFIAVRIKPRKSRWRLCRAVYLRRFYFKFSCSDIRGGVALIMHIQNQSGSQLAAAGIGGTRVLRDMSGARPLCASMHSSALEYTPNKHPERKIYAIWVYMPEETGRIILGV